MDQGMQLIPMMMIIGIDLYKSGIGLFFVINTVISWSSIMTIINGHLVDNYASKGPFLIIMRQNDENLGNFYFLIFFTKAAASVRAGALMMSTAFPSCCNVHLLHL
jgi:hypothetical protein